MYENSLPVIENNTSPHVIIIYWGSCHAIETLLPAAAKAENTYDSGWEEFVESHYYQHTLVK